MGLLRNIWCSMAHRRFTTWEGAGDWLIYRCTACNMAWPEPRYGQNPRGERHAAQSLTPTSLEGE